MKRLIDALIVLAVLAIVAAGIVYWNLRDDGDSAEPDRAGVPGEVEASLISSTGVEKNISERLTARTGREVTVKCPDKVDELVGTTFECDAFFAGESDVATVAKVEITGGGGQFAWTSENAETPEPSPTP
jgi:hypothetical protein